MDFEEAIASLSFLPPKDHETYVQTMDMRFGRKADKFMATADQHMCAGMGSSPESMARLYKLKNASWEMSLYISLLEMRLYRAIATWLVDNDVLSTNCIGEGGCDIGVLSCILAKMLPNRKIVGFDSNRRAIGNAKILAAQKKLTNIRFFHYELGAPKSQTEEQIDLLLLPFVLHELFHMRLFNNKPQLSDARAAEQIASMIPSGGSLISFERLPGGFVQAQPIIEELSSVGLDFLYSDTLVVPGPSQIEHFPVLVFGKYI